jgi:hypothetical protein
MFLQVLASVLAVLSLHSVLLPIYFLKQKSFGSEVSSGICGMPIA